MTKLNELLNQGRYEELWQRCCGFIDLSLGDFMKIQKRLLLEQLALLKSCELGRYILNGTNPTTVEEFQERIPLTTYADYVPYLSERREDVLPEKPLMWAHTSGRSGEYPFKWIPISRRLYEELGAYTFATIIFGSCKQRGEITLRKHDKYLYSLAPAPYFSGINGRRMYDEGVVDFLPPLEEAEKMEFAERIRQGFKLALLEGMDIYGGISSVLVSIGERFSQGGGNIDIKPFLRKPKALFRLTRGVVKSKLARRPLLPKDIWSLKGIMVGGTDSTVFKEKVRDMWGRYPLEGYGCTEATMIAMQTWDYQGMTFIPNLNFFEFIPERESLKLKENPAYQPETLLLNEVKAGENYELVITNLLGGALVRYRIGDLIKITSLHNEQLNIDIPQMVFYSRADSLLDIAGFTRLTESIIWRAIEGSGVAYKDWTIRKETKEKPKLHLYIELKENGHRREEDVALSIHQQLKKLDASYADLEAFLGLQPLEVTLLSDSAFQAYTLKQQAAGADLAHLKIPHINPSDSMLAFLINGSRQVVATSEERQPETVSSE